MRVLFVSERLGFLGGVEQNVADTADGLRDRGHTCTLAFGAPARGPEAYALHFDATVQCAEVGAPLGEGGGTTFAEIVGQVNPDVVYFHKVPTLRFAREWYGRVRTVRMLHDHDLCCPRRHKYFVHNGRVCNHPMGWRCYADLAFVQRDPKAPLGARLVSIEAKRRELSENRGVDVFVVASRFMRDELVMNGMGDAEIHICPPVTHLPNDDPPPLPAEPRILFVGQLVRGKGVDLLLRAMALLDEPWPATIVGTGNAADKLRALSARLGLESRVDFAGWIGRDRIGGYYGAASVLVVPSRWPEPFGMVGVEAMSLGRPVVAFAVGGIPDWLENEQTGLAVAEQDVKGLARALGRVLSDPSLASALGRQARATALSRYSFDAYLSSLESVLDGSIGTGTPSRHVSP